MTRASEDRVDDSGIERQRRHFNEIAEKYHQERQNDNYRYLRELIWSRFFAQTDLPARFAGKRVRLLEPMCGFCDGKELIERYLTPDVDYAGYDYSDAVIATVKAEHPGLDVWFADATKFVPEEGVYDIVLVIGALHHIPGHAAQAVGLMARGLKPGGYFINMEPTNGNPVFRLVREQIYRHNDLFDEQTERAFSLPELFAIFEQAGLVRVRAMYAGLLAFVFYYNPDAFPLLNVGGRRAVRTMFALDTLFMDNAIGRFLSFSTVSLWRKPE
jgi:SAM-dependent methyltransferase